jgi:hypothetical protein
MLHELRSYGHLLLRYFRGVRDRLYFYARNYRRFLLDIGLAVAGLTGGLSLSSINGIVASISLIVAAIGALSVVRHLRGHLTKAANVVPPEVVRALRDRILQDGEFAFWIDRQLNLTLDQMANPIDPLGVDYALPPLIRSNAPALFWNKPVKWKTTNEDKIRLSSDITRHAIKVGEPIRLQRTTYFDGLITNDLAGRKLRSGSVPRADIIDFNSLAYDGNKLVELSESAFSNHIGGSLLAITRDAKDTEIDPGMLAPAGSGSLDWQDISKLGGPGISFRDLIVGGLERELREEISAETGPTRSHTRLIGYSRVLHRGSKPEFVGLTLLLQAASDLRIRPREDGFVCEIKTYQMESMALRDVRAAAEVLRRDFERNRHNVGYALVLSIDCLCQFLKASNNMYLISSWYDEHKAV